MLDSMRRGAFYLVVKAVRMIRKVVWGLGGVDFAVDRFWSDERNLAVEGWVSAENETIDAVELKSADGWAKAELVVPRPDAPGRSPQGFVFQVAHGKPLNLEFRVQRKGRWTRHYVRRQPPDCQERLDVPDAERLFDPFVKEVNERKLDVLEIGSRIVSPGSSSKRSLFPGAASFTGFDYYPDSNTDIVGDAHRLSEYVGDRKFDAVFSIAVFEHLAMPWVVASEINKILKPGGITYHGTVFSWPAHERPWDFWRLSDEGLKVLFSPALGYEILGAGMFDPVSMHFRKIRAGHQGFPHAASYASAAILARKVAALDTSAFRWPSDVTRFVGENHHYPAHTAAPPAEG